MINWLSVFQGIDRSMEWVVLKKMPKFFFSAIRYLLPIGSNPLFVIAWAASGDTRNVITE